jgi:integrase
VKQAAKAYRLERNVAQVTQVVRDYIEETPLGDELLERVTTPMLVVHLKKLVPKSVINERARVAAGEKPRKLRCEKLGPESLNHVRNHLIQVFQRAIDTGQLIGTNPALKLKKKKVPKYAWTPLNAAEAQKLLEIAPMPYGAMIAGSLLALRKGELFGLDVADVDVTRWELHVHRSHSRPSPKSGQNRIVPIPPALRPFFIAAIEESHGGVLFPGRPDKDGKERRRHKNTKVGRVLDELLAKAGIKRHIRWHDLRHTAATLLLRADVQMQHVSKVVGHSSIAVTVDRYGHLVTEDLRAAIEKLPITAVEPKVVSK